MSVRFDRSFTQQAPLPRQAQEAAERVLQTARPHRYQADGDGRGETTLLEAEFAAWQGSTYYLAVVSRGQAIQLALRAAGVKHGDPVLVETTDDLVIDLTDLEAKAQRSGVRTLLLSLMRGHLPDMDAIMDIADPPGVTVIEDCAHTMGAMWNGRKSGSFGLAGYFSTQTYKHLNSGEGGFLATEDPDVAARMDNLRAAILRRQLAELDQAVDAWEARHEIIHSRLQPLSLFLVLPAPLSGARRVGSSIQFRVPSLSSEECHNLCAALCDAVHKIEQGVAA